VCEVSEIDRRVKEFVSLVIASCRRFVALEALIELVSDQRDRMSWAGRFMSGISVACVTCTRK
jgi:hypothetical protein